MCMRLNCRPSEYILVSEPREGRLPWSKAVTSFGNCVLKKLTLSILTTFKLFSKFLDVAYEQGVGWDGSFLVFLNANFQ